MLKIENIQETVNENDVVWKAVSLSVCDANKNDIVNVRR